MSFQSEAFKKYFIASGGKDASANSYSSGLKNIDLALQRAGRVGLDETIASDIGWLRSWVRSTDQPPFDKRPSDQRSFLNKYLYFLHQGDLLEGAQPNGTADDQSPLEPTGQAFQLEREMQSAVRRQISELEGGMRIADGGSERRVATGSVDILARDKDDVLVVIELKAGECPKGAVEQVL